MAPLALGAVSVGGGILGNVIGNAASSGSRDDANAATQAALQQWLKIHVPDPAQQRIELEKYKQTGQFSPSLQKTFQQSGTELKNLSVDPSGRAAEVEALEHMRNLANNGGMDAQSKQKEQEAINASNANEQGQRGAILQNYAARGVGGSGAELAAQLLSSQAGANRASSAGMQSASDAETRALQAMTGTASMGSNLYNQDYGQASRAAQAQDAINQFNVQNSQKVEGSNVGEQNDAQKYNLNMAQDVANKNIGLQNEQEKYNQGLAQKNFDNETNLARGISGGEQGVAAQENKNASDIAHMWGGIGSAISTGATGVAQSMSNKEKQKKDDSVET